MHSPSTRYTFRAAPAPVPDGVDVHSLDGATFPASCLLALMMDTQAHAPDQSCRRPPTIALTGTAAASVTARVEYRSRFTLRFACAVADAIDAERTANRLLPYVHDQCPRAHALVAARRTHIYAPRAS